MQNNKIFYSYTPFRNKLRKLSLMDSIYVIWGFSKNLTFDLPLPRDIQVSNDFHFLNIEQRRFRGIPEFELEFLLREIILNCNDIPKKDTIKDYKTLSKIINYLRTTFSEEVSKHSFSKIHEDDVFLEFHRMAHRQFLWQLGYNKNIITRNFKIYSHKKIEELIIKKLGLTTFELFILGFFFFRITGDAFLIKLPYKSQVPAISDEKIALFLSYFSITIEKAKEALIETQQMNENIFYTYNPLRAKPILIYQNNIFCPIQLMLFWQIPNLIYYSILNETGFENAFGESFENYVGEVLNKCCSNPSLKIIPEEKYGKEEKRTTDWILCDEKAILFIECKTKRMTMISKGELDINIKKGLVSDIQKMAQFITQLYKTYMDYVDNKYPTIKYDSSKKFIPLVLTLENWFINLNPTIMKILHKYVIAEFEKSALNQNLLNEFPYHIRSSDDFEKDIQIINEIGVFEYFDKISKFEIHDYIEKFKYKDVFEDEFHEMLIKPLEALK
jgi:hypothetical protein